MTDRMRRVNESVRQVLAETVPQLKDPRIGLVTVTGVDTSPDLRQATVYVSVLGSMRKRTATLRGLEAAHGPLQARLARELRLKRTPQLTFEYDPSVERGVRMTKLIDALAANDRFVVTSHENPDGDALGSLLAVTLGLRQLGKDVVMYLYGDAPVPSEYAFMPLDELVRRPPADAGERVLLAVDCAKADRLGPDPTLLERAPLVIDVDHHHDKTR